MILLGRVDIWVFFIRKLLWRSSDFSSACMKWKAYQDVPVESQQNVLLWHQWSCAFWDLIIFNHFASCYNKRYKKKSENLCNIAVRTEKELKSFQREPPHFPLPPSKVLPAFTVTWKCVYYWQSQQWVQAPFAELFPQVQNSAVFTFAFDTVVLQKDLKAVPSGVVYNCLLLGGAEIFKLSSVVKVWRLILSRLVHERRTDRWKL